MAEEKEKVMLFNSIEFAIFLPSIFIIYWFVTKTIKQQNILILLSSYIFYGWWDWRFLSLIFLSIVIDFLIGTGLEKNENHKLENIYYGPVY